MSVIVAVATVGEPKEAPPVGAESVMVKVSAGSVTASVQSVTLIGWLVTPLPKLRSCGPGLT
jgi:hypothetical protein